MVNEAGRPRPVETYEVDNAVVALILHEDLAKRRPPLSVGSVALDVVGRWVMIEGCVVHLPVWEATILEVPMRQAGSGGSGDPAIDHR
jgi:hypothetical protein